MENEEMRHIVEKVKAWETDVIAASKSLENYCRVMDVPASVLLGALLYTAASHCDGGESTFSMAALMAHRCNRLNNDKRTK